MMEQEKTRKSRKGIKYEKAYKSTWLFADRDYMDKTIFEMFERAMQESNSFKNKELFFKYAILLAMTGKRRIEPFLKPVEVKRIVTDKGQTRYKVHAVVAKHYEGKTKTMKCKICGIVLLTKETRNAHRKETEHRPFVRIGIRRESTHTFVAANAYQKALFDFLLKGNERVILDFTPLLPPRFQKEKGMEKLLGEYNKERENFFIEITKRFKMMKANIISPDSRKPIYTSITPHILRHAKAYNMLVNYNYDPKLIQRMLDWDGTEMLFAYADLAESIGERQEDKMYDEMVNR